MLINYVVKSKPKIGLEKNSQCNHFDIIRTLKSNKFEGTKDIAYELINKQNHDKSIELIHDEFASIMSQERIKVITKCLTLRFEYLFKELK